MSRVPQQAPAGPTPRKPSPPRQAERPSPPSSPSPWQDDKAPAAAVADVPQLIGEIESGLRSLHGNAAGFAALNRAADGAQDSPIVTWAAAFNGKTVEVQTDLAGLPVDSRAAVFNPLINLHGRQLLESAIKIHEASGTLIDVIRNSQEDADNGQA